MIEQDDCIVDQTLLDAINFTALNNAGIKQLQQQAGEVWTNYNSSDPGVTILEQLCYALTELGYCSQFPVEDVLTQSDGKIRYRDQFFEPQNILTTAPVTTDDFRRIVHDELNQVRVVYIDAVRDSAGVPNGYYQVSLAWQSAMPETEQTLILNRLYVSLNSQRNLGELFARPTVLTDRLVQVTGSVELTETAQSDVVYSAITQALAQYAAPLPQRAGYQECIEQGLTADDIFNGPRLQNGWIPSEQALGKKCEAVNLFDLNRLLANIPGVAQVQALSFVGETTTAAQATSTSTTGSVSPSSPPTPTISIPIAANQVAHIVLAASFTMTRNRQSVDSARQQSAEFDLAGMRAAHRAATPAAQIDQYPELPTGVYRDIESYYSIQNTFPDVYCLGANSLQSDTPSYRVASSRQLKGYLMVYDQMLANQFSQLAHLGDLFSFFPVVTKTHHDNLPEEHSDANPTHRTFTTTYFSQPLYDVPQVKPLLRGNDTFHYSFDPSMPPQKIELEAWRKFKKYPFNLYAMGLRDIAESDGESCARRDAMLSHLMARHGEDPNQYEDMIDSCQWYGSTVKTRILVKSVWLQNFQLLSYYRNTAFDITARRVLLGPGDPTILKAGKSIADLPTSQRILQGVYPMHEGEIDQAKFFADSRIRKSDLGQYSIFELKLGILLGLSAHYQMLAAELFALLESPEFQAWLKLPVKERTRFALPDSNITVVAGKSMDQVFSGQQCLLDVIGGSYPPNRQDYLDHANQLLWLGRQRKGVILIEHILLSPPVAQVKADSTPISGNATNGAANRPDTLQATLILPKYVTLIQSPEFTGFIETIKQLHWPAHLQLTVTPKSFLFLKAFIPVFVKWWNNLHKLEIRDPLSVVLSKLLLRPTSSGGAHAN